LTYDLENACERAEQRLALLEQQPGPTSDHLADGEIIYGYRLQQMLADSKPVIAPLDPDRRLAI
jgi:hypothetical protein